MGRNRKIRGAVESPAKGKGKAKAKATTKAPVRGKGKGKGKMVKEEEDNVIDVDALSDLDPEEYLLQEAIKVSLLPCSARIREAGRDVLIRWECRLRCRREGNRPGLGGLLLLLLGKIRVRGVGKLRRGLELLSVSHHRT